MRTCAGQIRPAGVPHLSSRRLQHPQPAAFCFCASQPAITRIQLFAAYLAALFCRGVDLEMGLLSAVGLHPPQLPVFCVFCVFAYIGTPSHFLLPGV
jgi:hypothetical protein